jgi:hypothetical protein
VRKDDVWISNNRLKELTDNPYEAGIAVVFQPG